MKKAIVTTNAPKAIGPYSQAVQAGNFLYVSGQIPLECVSGSVVEGGIEVQAKQVFENLNKIVKAAEYDLTDVIKTTVFLSDIGDFSKVNEIYAEYFNGDVLPARAVLQAVALPKGVMIEIELVAYK